MTLDGLAQEAGAVLRPLLEVLEMMQYLCEDPGRLNEPKKSAGEIAKEVDSGFLELRKALNATAAHLSADYRALRHLVGPEGLTIVQPYREMNVRINMRMLHALLVLVQDAAGTCLFVVRPSVLTRDLLAKLERFRLAGARIMAKGLERRDEAGHP